MIHRWDWKALLLAVLIPAFFAQSYLHAKAVVAGERKGCARISERLALDANNLRGDVSYIGVQERGSRTLASSSKIPAPARTERWAEARAASRAVGRKLREIGVIDGQIDAAEWRHLLNHQDRARVRSGAFLCARAFPEPPVLGG